MSLRLIVILSIGMLISACGGGGSGSTSGDQTPTIYSAVSGIAQKGPLQLGSLVTVQELDEQLSPTGSSYTFQIDSDLGTFSPTSQFTNRYLNLNAIGYYYDEVTNTVSSGTLTLNGISDMGIDTMLNVNLLTTLAYQRIKTLVTTQNMTVAAARTQAEGEVLVALNIYSGSSFSNFGSLDISGDTDGDNMLTAISSLFVYGNSAGELSLLISGFQSDIATNGEITISAINTALTTAAKNLNPATVATNLSAKYALSGITFTETNISDWIAQDGDGVIGKFTAQLIDANSASTYTLLASFVTFLADKPISISQGQFSVNGTTITGTATFAEGDTVVVSPSSSFNGGEFPVYLINEGIKLAKVTFLHTLVSVAVTPSSATTGVGLAESLSLMGTYLNGTQSAITSGVTWSSSNTSVATVNNVGTVTGVATGTSLVTATFGELSSNATLTVKSDEWSAAENMSMDRHIHTATLLSNGKVLVVGGQYTSGTTGNTSSAELYDSATNTWSAAGSMTTGRSNHTATLLSNGKVLVVGGANFNEQHASAELYDSATNTWSAAGSMTTARILHTATRLSNGKVLVAGGYIESDPYLSSAELYDSATNTWSAAGSMTTARILHTATRLSNGKVLVAGGQYTIGGFTSSAELYDSATNTWSAAASMSTVRIQHTATRLSNGKVLVVGGYSVSGSGSGSLFHSSTELYDSATNTWSAAGSMTTARYSPTASLLLNGEVLVAGGNNISGSAPTSAERYDSATNTWSAAASMSMARDSSTATLLSNGKVLVAGGTGLGVSSAELYVP